MTVRWIILLRYTNLANIAAEDKKCYDALGNEMKCGDEDENVPEYPTDDSKFDPEISLQNLR